MKIAVILAALVAVTVAHRPELDLAWGAWKIKFSKSYENVVEESVRRMLWQDTFDEVSHHNMEYSLGLHTYDQALNSRADITPEEHKASCGYVAGVRDEDVEEHVMIVGTPSTKNWDSEGYVTSVKNQASCGSCWAFSAAAATSSACAIKHGKNTLTNLSQQELVSCDKNGCGGCNGGNYESAFNYYKSPGAITLKNYPYTSGNGRTGSCEKSGKPIWGKTSGYKRTQSKSESSLENAVGNVEPVSVSIDASQNSFSNYNSGIYYSSTCSSTNLDHAVLTVGYNQNSQGQYWIVKNSWGTGWGQNGYIWMAKNRNNNCGIATSPAYPQCA